MQRFVVVASRGAPTIGDRTIGLLSDPAPPSLPFDPHDHVHWRSSNGLVHVASWSADELVRPTARTVEGGIVALGGLPIVTQPSDAATFLRPEAVAEQPAALEALTERLDGPYAIVAIRSDGAGTVVNDPFGLHPVYVSEFGSSWVLANDAALVAAVLESLSGRVPEPDEDAVAWLLLNGQMFGDATPYRGVRRLPFGSAAHLLLDGEVALRPWHEPPWLRSDLPAATVDAAERRMRATVDAAVAAAPDAVSSELTGGKDSRLVLELAALAGLADQIRFCTYGPPTAPDSVAASEIAQKLGLRFETGTWPSLPGGPTLENFVAHVRRVSAQIPCWEMAAPRETNGITLSGLTGESLRTNFPRVAGLTTVDDATAAFARHRFGRYHYVRPDALDDLQQRSRRLFAAPLEQDAAPEDLFDIFYVQHRLRRWIGDKPDRFVRYVFPLYSPAAVRAAMTSGWEARANASFHEEVARRAGLPLANVSFEQGTRWRSPAPANGGGVAPAASAPTRADELRAAAIRDAVEFDAANPAFELVDRNLMLADVGRYRELDRRRQIELHHALTVVLWLGLARPDLGTVTE